MAPQPPCYNSNVARVLMVSPEATPLAKTGGLADVAGALPEALRSLGDEAALVIPRYGSIDIKGARRVYATPLQPPAPETNAGKYQEVLDQRNREFMPHVLVVRSGTEVSFPNHDKIRHHVYSFSPAKRFEIKLYGDLTPTPILFDMAGIAVLGCNIHDWMVSYVYVTDSPYFAKTDVSGHWSLNLPVDSYTISYWHPYMEQIQSIMPETIQVDGGQDILLNRAIQIKSHYRNGKPPLSGQEEGYKVDP